MKSLGYVKTQRALSLAMVALGVGVFLIEAWSLWDIAFVLMAVSGARAFMIDNREVRRIKQERSGIVPVA